MFLTNIPVVNIHSIQFNTEIDKIRCPTVLDTVPPWVFHVFWIIHRHLISAGAEDLELIIRAGCQVFQAVTLFLLTLKATVHCQILHYNRITSILHYLPRPGFRSQNISPLFRIKSCHHKKLLSTEAKYLFFRKTLIISILSIMSIMKWGLTSLLSVVT